MVNLVIMISLILRLAFSPSSGFISGKQSCQNNSVLRVFLIILMSPFIHVLLMVQEKRAVLDVKQFLQMQDLNDHERFKKLIYQCNQSRFQVKRCIKLELGLEAIFQLTMKLILLSYAYSDTRTSHTLVQMFRNRQVLYVQMYKTFFIFFELNSLCMYLINVLCKLLKTIVSDQVLVY